MILRAPAASCGRHRAALLDFVDRRERGPGTEVALAHLAGCRSCEGDLSEIALVTIALRRWQAEVKRMEPSPDAWERVRRVATQRQVTPPWHWRLSLGARMLAAALVAVMVMPVAFGQPSATVAPLGDDVPATLVGKPAGAASETRIYEPPAGTLTAGLVTILARDDAIGRPREARALTHLPAATDRTEPQRAAARPAATTEVRRTPAATPD